MTKYTPVTRTFVATVTYADGRVVTTTVHGPHASAAEEAGLAERRADGAVRVVVHAEVAS